MITTREQGKHIHFSVDEAGKRNWHGLKKENQSNNALSRHYTFPNKAGTSNNALYNGGVSGLARLANNSPSNNAFAEEFYKNKK